MSGFMVPFDKTNEIPTMTSHRHTLLPPISFHRNALLAALLALAPTLEAVEIASRELARQHYLDSYLTGSPPIGWTGDYARDDPGTTSQGFRDAVIRQVNYFREQAGLVPVTENPEYSRKAQRAALMMSVNDSLNHNPPAAWRAYTAEGKEAAGKSNLALAVTGDGPVAVASYIDDPSTSGFNNSAVGHRKWLLRPRTTRMGTGDTPRNLSPRYPRANALWVVTGETAPQPQRHHSVAWPPVNGYTPYQVVYERWSLNLPGADFRNASVAMWDRAGNPVDLTVISRPAAGGDPENHLVWEPDLAASIYWRPRRTPPTDDEWYRVEISSINGYETDTFAYTVVVFDPATGPAENNLEIEQQGGQVFLRWPTPDPDYWKLYKTTDFVNWNPVDTSGAVYDGFEMRLTYQPDQTNTFFRLLNQ